MPQTGTTIATKAIAVATDDAETPVPAERLDAWLAAHPLMPVHVDCVTAVMLKILDGKCKMAFDEKAVMTRMYAAVRQRPGIDLDDRAHRLIEAATQGLEDALRERIYEQRVLAETMISRPVMKAFKAWLRSEGILQTSPRR